MIAVDRDRLQELDRYLTEYAELQYPDDETRRSLTDSQLQARDHTARGRACVVADMVIELGIVDALVDSDGRVNSPDLARTLADRENWQRDAESYDYEAQWETDADEDGADL